MSCAPCHIAYFFSESSVQLLWFGIVAAIAFLLAFLAACLQLSKCPASIIFQFAGRLMSSPEPRTNERNHLVGRLTSGSPPKEGCLPVSFYLWVSNIDLTLTPWNYLKHCLHVITATSLYLVPISLNHELAIMRAHIRDNEAWEREI